MMFRIARASLAVLAVFNVASSFASPETVSSAWAQHARRLSQNPRTSCATARLYRGPSPPQCLEGDGPWAHDAKTPSRPSPSRPPPPICLWIAPRPLSASRICLDKAR